MRPMRQTIHGTIAGAITITTLVALSGCGAAEPDSATAPTPATSTTEPGATDSATNDAGHTDDPTVMAQDEALMDRAMETARATYPEFVAMLNSPGAAHSGFSVKRGFDAPGGGVEYIWIGDLTWDGTQFHGTIGNEPQHDVDVVYGEAVTVTPEQLADWMYIDGRTVVGGYTLRVIHFEMTEAERADFEAQTGLIVPPIDF